MDADLPGREDQSRNSIQVGVARVSRHGACAVSLARQISTSWFVRTCFYQALAGARFMRHQCPPTLLMVSVSTEGLASIFVGWRVCPFFVLPLNWGRKLRMCPRSVVCAARCHGTLVGVNDVCTAVTPL